MPIKTIRCRHFDAHGRPVSPYCRRGSQCDWVHPTDKNWDECTWRIMPARRNSSPARVDELKIRSLRDDRGRRPPSRGRSRSPIARRPSSPHNSARPRGSPLAPQGRMFERVKTEDENSAFRRQPAMSHARHEGAIMDLHSPDSRHMQNRPREDKDRGRPPNHGHAVSSLARYEHPDNSHENRINRRFFSDAPRSHAAVSLRQATLLPSLGIKEPAAAPAEDYRAEKLAKMFRELAGTTNAHAQDTAVLAEAAMKKQRFSKISQTLKDISTNSNGMDLSSSVVPVLDSISAEHADSEVRVRDGERAISAIWENVLEFFLESVTGMAEVRVKQILQPLLNQANDAGDRLTMLLRQLRDEEDRRGSWNMYQRGDKEQRLMPPGGHHETSFIDRGEEPPAASTNKAAKRTAYMRDVDHKHRGTLDDAHDMAHKAGNRRDYDQEDVYKRRRFRSPGHSQDNSIRERDNLSSRAGAYKEHASGDGRSRILEEMRMKIQEQAQQLERLSKENNELKLQRTLPETPVKVKASASPSTSAAQQTPDLVSGLSDVSIASSSGIASSPALQTPFGRARVYNPDRAFGVNASTKPVDDSCEKPTPAHVSSTAEYDVQKRMLSKTSGSQAPGV